MNERDGQAAIIHDAAGSSPQQAREGWFGGAAKE